MAMIAAILGRLMLAALFILSGIQKVMAPGGTAEYIESRTTLPGTFALGIGIFEIVAGLLLALGLMTRLVSIILAAFTLATIFFFHNQFTDPAEGVQALKNIAIAGGLLMVFAYGQVRGTFDHYRSQRKVQDAELRAARAEGKAEGAAERPIENERDVRPR